MYSNSFQTGRPPNYPGGTSTSPFQSSTYQQPFPQTYQNPPFQPTQQSTSPFNPPQPQSNPFSQSQANPFSTGFQAASQLPRSMSQPSSGHGGNPFTSQNSFQQSQPPFQQSQPPFQQSQSSFQQPQPPFQQSQTPFSRPQTSHYSQAFSSQTPPFQSNFGSQLKGTKGVSFVAPQEREGAYSTNINNIAAMQQFQTKSIEELRYEDYKFNKETPQQFSGPQNSFSVQNQPVQNQPFQPFPQTTQVKPPFQSSQPTYSQPTYPQTNLQNQFSQSSTPFQPSNPYMQPASQWQKPQSSNPFQTSFSSSQPPFNPNAPTPNKSYSTTTPQPNPFSQAAPSFSNPPQFYAQPPQQTFQLPPTRTEPQQPSFFAQNSPYTTQPSVFAQGFNPTPMSQGIYSQTPNTAFARSQAIPSMPQSESLVSAYKDPYGISWLFPGMDPDNLVKKYQEKLETTTDNTSIIDKMLKTKTSQVKTKLEEKPKTLPQENKWKTTVEKKFFSPKKPVSLEEYSRSAEAEPFSFTKRASFMGLKLEPVKESENKNYLKAMHERPKTEYMKQVTLVAFDPKPFKLDLHIHTHTKIREIKKEVESNLKDIDPSRIKLTYKNKVLSDDEEISSVGISDQEYITVIISNSVTHHDLAPESALPKISKPGYSTVPTALELGRMSVSQLSAVPNFTIQNQHGKIVFDGTTDLVGLNLDEIVNIEEKQVVLYPDDNDPDKPRIGEGLNKPALVVLYNCRPRRNVSPEAYREKIKAICKKNGSEFLDWNDNTFEWSFRVKHF